MPNEELTQLPAHYEQHLGEIARGWSDKKRMHGVQVVCFEGQPEPGVRTFATLGLSRHIVDQPSSKHVRQELLISANDAFSSEAIAGLVLSLAEHVLQRGRALLRGEVIEAGMPVFTGSTLAAIYVTNPSPFDKPLSKFALESESLIFAYLVPITKSEALLARERGWRWFEEQLEQQNPDVWDFARTEAIQATA